MDTISFGTPIGSARMAGAMIAVPPEPPSPMVPPRSLREAMNFVSATDMAVTATPRSSAISTAFAPSGWNAAMASAEKSASRAGVLVPTSTVTALTPASRRRFAT